VLTGEQVRLRGVDGGDEGVSQKDAAQGVEGVDAVGVVPESVEVLGRQGGEAERRGRYRPPF